MITVLGATGFVGSGLVTRLETLGVDHYSVDREADVPAANLGHVIYCIGLTADFRSRPFDTVAAHVCKLLEVLQNCRFDSLLYLSSTRLYSGANDSTIEESVLRIAPLDPSDLYNASKAMGESIVLNCGRHGKVARLSNVYGCDVTSENFLASIIRDAITRKKVMLHTSPDSAKDYISLDDVVDGLIQIATSGKEQIYNLASGVNVTNAQLTQTLRALTDCAVEFSQAAQSVNFPPINIDRMKTEFDFQPSFVLDDLPQLVESYKRNLESSHGQG